MICHCFVVENHTEYAIHSYAMCCNEHKQGKLGMLVKLALHSLLLAKMECIQILLKRTPIFTQQSAK